MPIWRNRVADADFLKFAAAFELELSLVPTLIRSRVNLGKKYEL